MSLTSWPCRIGVYGAVFALHLQAPAYSQPPADKSGARPTVLSLPSGPGSIEGLGAGFQPHLNTGGVSRSVPLQLPPGPAGFAPSLILRYDTGFGNGPLGRGWRLGGPLAIERQTAKGFPRYRDAADDDGRRDVFVFQGEELVPLSDGTYRLENDGSSRRFSPISSRSGVPPDAWLIEDPDGARHWLGRHAGDAGAGVSRVVHPRGGGRGPFEETYRWLEDAAEDVHGNRIDYRYLAHADSPGVLYLQRVTYHATGGAGAAHVVELHTEPRPDRIADYRAGFERRWARRYRDVSVGSRWGGRLHPVRAYVLSYDVAEGAELPNPGGAEGVGLGVSALHAVTVFGADRGWGGDGAPGTALPAERFTYSTMVMAPAAPVRAAGPAERLRLHGRAASPTGPIVRRIRQRTASGAWRPIFDVPLHDPDVDLVDVDADGLPDFLDTRLVNGRREYAVARNIGRDRFEESRPLRWYPSGVGFGQSRTDLQAFPADANADGAADLVRIVGSGAQRRTEIYPNLAGDAPALESGVAGFASEPIVAYGTPSPVDTMDPDARQIDLDFDKIPDLLVSSDGQWTGYLARPDGTWEPRAVAVDGAVSRDYRFSIDLPGERRGPHALVHLADMNGDRLQDLVRVYVRELGVAEMRYRPMTGPLTWGPEVVLHAADRRGVRLPAPARTRLPGIAPNRADVHNRWDAVRVMDVNGDGPHDLVFIEPGAVRVYLNVHGHALSGPYVVHGTPRYQPRDSRNPTWIRSADVNGNGSTDLVFHHRSGGPNLQGLWYLDFIGGQKPGLLLAADNGIGLRSYVRYKPAVADQVAARDAGAPWTRVSPVRTWVVAAIVEDIGLDLDRDDEPDRRVTTFRYRDPYYDGLEKQFRGFGFVEKTAWGDEVDPATGRPAPNPGPGHRTTVTRTGFHTGAPDGTDNDEYLDGFDVEPRPAARVFDEWSAGGREEEPLKGRLFLEEVIDPLALGDPSADFDACARALVRETARSAAAPRCTPDRYVYRREAHRWRIRRLYRPAGVAAPKGRRLQDEPHVTARNGRTVSFPHRAAVEITLPEANGVLRDAADHPHAPVKAAGPVTLAVEYEYDDFGNVVVERNRGVASGPDPSLDDERVVRMTFAQTTGADGRIAPWIVDRLVRRRVEDEHGAFVAEERRYYDGAPFLGLPLGQLGERGLVSRREARVHDGASDVPSLSWLPADADQRLPGPGDPRVAAEWTVQERAAYDAVGNRVAAVDGLARLTADGRIDPEHGHVTLTRFDPVFRTFPVEERLQVGGGRPDLVFRSAYVSPETEHAAAMHWGHGVMTRSWDANGHRTDYLHDRHGRLTAVRSPGDTEALPSVVHTYRLADPHRGLRYDYDRSGGLQPAGAPVPIPAGRAANAVVTDRREVSGETGVFRRIVFTTGDGVEVSKLEEDGSRGYAVMRAVRLGRRGTPVFEAQPYRQPTANFAAAGPDVPGTDMWRDSLDRVTRRRLPPETDRPGAPRRETRVHYLPLAEWRFDEEDLTAADPSQDHRGTPLVLQWDGLDRLIAVTEHVRTGGAVKGWKTRYVHDLNDKLSGVLDSRGNLRVVRHDGLGRRIALHDVNRGLLRFSFDAAGNVTETLDARDQRITYGYDGLNRLVSEDHHDAGRTFSSGRDHDAQRPVSDDNQPDVVYTYDTPSGPIQLDDGRTLTPANTRGFLTGVSDRSGEEHVSYDARGRIAWRVKRIEVAGGSLASYLIGMAHDASDRLTAIEYPDGTELSYRYDARSRPRRIDSPQLGVILADQTYTPAGLPAVRTYGNGVRHSIAYDPRLRASAITTRSPRGGPPLMDYRYRYDGASNVLAIDDRRPAAVRAARFDNSQRFTYDNLHRMTGAAYTTGRLSLAYDPIGNLIHRRFAPADASASRGFGPGRIRHGGSGGSSGRIGRPTAAPGPHAPTADDAGGAYTYDANGNLTRRGDTSMTWDFKDRLVVVEAPGRRAEYVYDHAGRRIVKRVWEGIAPDDGPPAETLYVSRYFHVAEGTAYRYLFAGETRLAYAPEGGEPVFLHQDLVTSTDVLSDASGTLVQSNAFLPFGDIRERYDPRAAPPASGAAPEYAFHQKERDPETGLSYFEARYLDSGIGRFIRVDPVVLDLTPDTLEAPQLFLNGYAFAGNNALRYGDGSGEKTHQMGVTLTGGFLVKQVTGSVYVVWDDAGNAGVMFTGELLTALGPGTVNPANAVSGSITGKWGGSTAASILDLNGGGGVAGVSLQAGPSMYTVEGGVAAGRDGKPYFSSEVGVGPARPGAGWAEYQGVSLSKVWCVLCGGEAAKQTGGPGAGLPASGTMPGTTARPTISPNALSAF